MILSAEVFTPWGTHEYTLHFEWLELFSMDVEDRFRLSLLKVLEPRKRFHAKLMRPRHYAVTEHPRHGKVTVMIPEKQR